MPADPKAVLEFIFENLETPEAYNQQVHSVAENYEPIHVDTFSDLMDRLRERFYVTEAFEDVMATIFAVHISVKLSEEPLWFFVFGPPSSGKTVAIDAIDADKEGTFAVNKLSSFFSGWKDDPKDDKDHSLLPLINHRLLLIKDFTSIITMGAQAQDNFFGQLRDISDGKTTVSYGNSAPRQYDGISFGIVAGVTDEIHALNRAELGERFLKIDVVDKSGSQDKLLDIASRSAAKSVSASMASLINRARQEAVYDAEAADGSTITMQRGGARVDQIYAGRCTVGFIRSMYRTLHTRKIDLEIPEWLLRAVRNLAQFTAAARAKVKREGKDRDLVYRPRREHGSRLAKQLIKYALCLHAATGWEWDRVYKTVRKVAFQTGSGISLEVLTKVAESGNKGVTKGRLALKLGLTGGNVYRRITDLRELKALKAPRIASSGGAAGGADLHYFRLADDLAEAWRNINDPHAKPKPKRRVATV